MASNNEKSPRRREFLKLMGAGGAAAGAVAATVAPKKADAAQAAPDSKGYRESEHVMSYYKSAKF
jgi:anaerobic selenocysteine-containing dehydrogenase